MSKSIFSLKRLLLSGTALSILAVVAISLLVWWSLNRTVSVGNDGLVFIPENTTVVAAIDTVCAHVTMPTPWLVATVARATARIGNKQVYTGWYEFDEGDSQLDVLQKLFNGQQRSTVKLTIPEGLTYKEIAGLVAKEVDTDSIGFVRWCENPENVNHYAKGAPSMEGFLMPNTYNVFWRTKGADVAKRLAEEWQRAHKDSVPTLAEQTLASIVQAEAVVDYEMQTIAGVYTNRLHVGMTLSADPTVQYAIGEKRRLLYKDLDHESKYNTYRWEGLPPGPINNPGMKATVSARHPELHEFFFFCAKGDGSGEHRFARTDVEHAANVSLYRRTRGTVDN